MADYTESLTAVGIDFALLDDAEIVARWPQFALPAGTVGLFQERGAIVPAGRGTAVMQRLAVAAGADLRDRTPVLSVEDRGAAGIEVVDRRRPVRGRPGRRLRRRVDQRGARRSRRPAARSRRRWSR